MKQKIIYLFPATIDVLVGTFFFISMVRMAQSGTSAASVSALMALWGIGYMIVCPIAGRLVSVQNCISMLVGSSVGMACCAGLFLLLPQLQMLFVIMAIFGATVAFFFPPFQFFMKDFSAGANESLAHSAALYTISWSLGLSAGPFISGYLWSFAGWQWICILDIILALITAVGILATRRWCFAKNASAVNMEISKKTTYSEGRPNMVIIAWIGSGAFLLVMAMARAVFPSVAVADNISKTHQGNTMALMSLGQAIGAYLVRNGTHWFYKPLPIGLTGLVSMAGLVAFGCAHTWPSYYLASLCLGACAGIVFIYLVFHALVHPTRAGRYAGINESIIGMTGIIGPLVGGVVLDTMGRTHLYGGSIIFYAIVLIVQVVAHVHMGRGR